MNIKFKKIVLHNFLSFGHAEITLENKGYCLVSGINKCPKDRSISNGSGKSSIWSGISWALTGETIQGITSSIKNININEKLCYVSLDFLVDSNHFIITRYKEPKSNLKIIVDDVDKSGKGIKESENILATYLPDLDKNVISSVILLGQGLPNKLSSHTPSGRKELLEKLSKSDFMIEDIKRRISSRISKVNSQKREYEDKILETKTLSTSSNNQMISLQQSLENFMKTDYFVKIEELKNKVAELEKNISLNEESISKSEKLIEDYNTKVLNTSNQKQKTLSDEFSAYSVEKEKLSSEYASNSAAIKSLKKEVMKLKSIKDICPTCGQKIPNVVKPNTDAQELEIKNLQSKIDSISEKQSKCESHHQCYMAEINGEFDTLIENDTITLKNEKNSVNALKSSLMKNRESMLKYSKELQSCIADNNAKDTYIKTLQDNISKLSADIENYTELLTTYESKNADCQNHLDCLKKMDTFVKRDFRGYLLENVISFIDSKMKDYCSDVFGSNDLEFKLNGNNIDITYCNKPYESLSGGEKQKVDLVVQFSVREMMYKYLNFSSNILVLDEIFDNLDTIGTDNVLNLIATRLSDIESTFIISHHSDELNIPYDSEIVVEKNAEGISEVK